MEESHLYQALCLTLAGAGEQVEWQTLSARDWEDFTRLSVEQRVAPLVYAALRSGEPAGLAAHVSGPARDALARVYYTVTARNQVLFQEMERFLPALAGAGIPVVALKGAALAQTLYPEAGLRPMSDVDLLIPGTYLRQAVRLFRRLGYIQEKITYHAVMRGGPQNACAVEIHWHLVPNQAKPEGFVFEWLWARRAPLPGCPVVSMFTPEATWVYLIAHLAAQNQAEGMQLLWYYDLWLALNRWGSEMDWVAVRELAARAGWQDLLRGALAGVATRFPVQMPGGVADLVDETPSPGNLNRHYVPVSEYIRKAIFALDGSTRIFVILSLLFPAPSYLRWRYSPVKSILLPWYYLRRWWEIAASLTHG